MAKTFDAVIVGGGHNGLVTAAYLAGGGLDVLVLERRPYVGGACVTEEPWPGYKVSTAAYVLSLLRREVVRDLDLKQHGLVVYPQDPPYFQPYPDGRSLMIWNDYTKTRAEIAKFSRHDAEVYEEYERTLNRLAEFVEPLLMMTPPDPASRRLRDLFGLLKVGRMARRLKQDLYEEVAILSMSAKDFLDSWFESEELKALLCGQAVIGTFAGPRTPGTAYVLFHHVMGEVDGMRGCWGVVRGGMGQVSECIATEARKRGVDDPLRRAGRAHPGKGRHGDWRRDPRRRGGPRPRRGLERRPEGDVPEAARRQARTATSVHAQKSSASAPRAPRSRSTTHWASCPTSRRCAGPARPTARRHHRHLPVARLHGARLRRGQVRELVVASRSWRPSSRRSTTTRSRRRAATSCRCSASSRPTT